MPYWQGIWPLFVLHIKVIFIYLQILYSAFEVLLTVLKEHATAFPYFIILQII